MTDSKILLECVYYWEKNTPDRMYFTQPMGGDDANIRTWSWKEAVDEARRMAAYLKSLDLPDRSHIALCSKNCAYWIIADLAIWMAGHVSIPVFPILTVDIVQYTGVPADLPMIAFPLAPENDHTQWDDIIAKHEPLAEPVKRTPEETATIIYTSGSTGKPKGAMMSFSAMHKSAKGICEYLKTRADDRVLSYLPLSHSFERWVVETHSFYAGFSLYFAETLDTFLQDLQRARPTLFISVPRLWLKFQF
jgi:long-subunit acyl-CoA synthetase (AMP-forming)